MFWIYVIAFTVPANPKSFFSFIKPAASNSLSARAWFDTSFGMTTLAPSLTFLTSLILSDMLNCVKTVVLNAEIFVPLTPF